ncbi:SDR family NAD(P)-dependent oxidoreductase [Membranihabitans marinus]|uniref:SDR family NAD(P)-dependent oxidoreductase n=1 Tax=Membranihabitans marinus TaxID=1227546 RepID=UPI001F193B19|nr:SDR family oxidoreductase [Membranihabitans marinus]
MNKDKKVAIITGAAGGIGRATALRFAREDYRLLLSDIDESGLQSLSADLVSDGMSVDDFVLFPGDLMDLTYAQSMVKECVSRWNAIDVLVNNAIWRSHETMRSMAIDRWEKTIKIGLTVPAFLSKWVAEVMESEGRKGVIVNISSVMSVKAGGTSPAYTVCKGGIESLTFELASLYGRSGIRVVAIAPGNVLTSLSDDFVSEDGENLSGKMEASMADQTPLKRSGQSSEIANAIYWVSSPEASFVSGTVIQVDGGYSHGFNRNSLKNLQFPNQF